MARFYKTTPTKLIPPVEQNVPFDLALNVIKNLDNHIARGEEYKTSLFDKLKISVLDADKETVQQDVDTYKNAIDSFTGMLQKDPLGYIKKISSMKDLGRKLNKNLTSGKLYQAIENKKNLDKWLKRNLEMNKNNPENYEDIKLLRNTGISSYKGVDSGQEGVYNTLNIPDLIHNPGIQQKASKLAKDFYKAYLDNKKVIPSDIVNKPNSETFVNEMYNYIQPIMRDDQQIQSYLKQQISMGKLTPEEADKILENTISREIKARKNLLYQSDNDSKSEKNLDNKFRKMGLSPIPRRIKIKEYERKKVNLLTYLSNVRDMAVKFGHLENTGSGDFTQKGYEKLRNKIKNSEYSESLQEDVFKFIGSFRTILNDVQSDLDSLLKNSDESSLKYKDYTDYSNENKDKINNLNNIVRGFDLDFIKTFDKTSAEIINVSMGRGIKDTYGAKVVNGYKEFYNKRVKTVNFSGKKGYIIKNGKRVDVDFLPSKKGENENKSLFNLGGGKRVKNQYMDIDGKVYKITEIYKNPALDINHPLDSEYGERFNSIVGKFKYIVKPIKDKGDRTATKSEERDILIYFPLEEISSLSVPDYEETVPKNN